MVLVQEIFAPISYYIEEYFFIFVLTNVAVFIIYLAWRLSCRPCLTYNVNLIQTYQSSTLQRVQIINADPERINADELVNLITEEHNPVDSTSGNRSDYTLRIRALVVRSPARAVEQQNNNLSNETTVIELPVNTNRHISEIYNTIQHYTDPSIAGAIVVSLFRNLSRRLSSQNNHLQISQLLSEVGSDIDIAPSIDETFTVSIPEHEGSISTDSSTLSSSSMSSSDESESLFTDSVPTPSSEQQVEVEVDSTTESNAEQPGDSTIKLKFLDDTEKVVKTKLSATIIEFKKANFTSQVASGKTIRLIFRGQLLRDDNRSLKSYGLEENSIVHCHINNRPYAQTTTTHSNSSHTNRTVESNYIDNTTLERPVFDEVANETFLMRSLRMGVYYADVIPFFMFYGLTTCLNWIRAAENLVEDPNAPFAVRQMTRLRRWLFSVFRIFVDFNEQPDINDVFGNRFNLGVLFTLLFTVKFMSIWIVVMYFPQYTDAKGVFILLVLTVVFGLYTFQNRPMATRANNHNQQQGNSANEIHIQ